MQYLTVASRVIVVAVLALAGCGGSDDEPPSAQERSTVSGDQRNVLATVDALQSASRDGDGKRVCDDLFSRALVQSVEATAGRSCATEVRQRLFSPDAEISVDRDIRVAGSRGTAVVHEQNGNVSKLSFVKQNARWRIDRVTPQNSG